MPSGNCQVEVATTELAGRERIITFVINARNSPDAKRGATVLAELPDDLISVSQGAKLAKMHVSALWRWAMKGKIAHWRRGSRVFVRRSDVIGLFKHNPKGAP